MFDWIRRMFGKKTVNSRISDYQTKQQVERFLAYRDNRDTSDVMKMLVKDFEARSRKQDGGGSSSSPISSP